MKVLLSKGKLLGLKSVEHSLYEGCIFGKQKKVSFSKVKRELKAEKLELIHTNVWGPLVPFLGGSNYYVTFIDDLSKKWWVYFLKYKSNVFYALKKWRAMVENESNLNVKCL